MFVTGVHWWSVNIGSGNGLVLCAIRQQAITWANIDADLCHHMASIGHKELIGQDIKVESSVESKQNNNTVTLL